MRRILASISAACLLMPAIGLAQGYPDRPVKIISPFAAGGAADSVARLVADALATEFGQPFVVENKPGAGGTVGSALVAKSKPDGYTIGIASLGTQVVSPLLMKLSYDPKKDLVPVVNVASSPNVLLTHPGFPASNFADFQRLVLASPGKVSYASSGVGANNHIFCETILTSISGSMNHVPYKGSAPGLTDLMGGQVDTMCDVSMALTHVKAGKLKLLAIGAPARLAAFPDAPTMAELGHPQANFSAWYGVVVPNGTPAQIQEQINTAVNKALKTNRALSTLATMDALPIGGTSADFRRTIETDSANIQQVIRSKGIRVEQ